MSVLAIVLIAILVLVVLLLAAGYAASGRRAREGAAEYARHLAESDHALERARAEDRGWDRVLMEEAARSALAADAAGWAYDRLDLVLVDDRPGVEDDRAVFEAVGADERRRVTVVRDAAGHWIPAPGS